VSRPKERWMKGEKTDYCVENVDYLGAAWWQEEKKKLTESCCPSDRSKDLS